MGSSVQHGNIHSPVEQDVGKGQRFKMCYQAKPFKEFMPALVVLYAKLLHNLVSIVYFEALHSTFFARTKKVQGTGMVSVVELVC